MVKEKPNSTRMYDSEGYRRRAACICVKNDLEDEVKNMEDTFFTIILFSVSFLMATVVSIKLSCIYKPSIPYHCVPALLHDHRLLPKELIAH